MLLWVGNEIDSYIPSGSNAFEEGGVQDAGQREGMRVCRSDGSNVTSSPDWAAANEIWHRFNFQCDGGYTAGFILWAVKDATGQILAQIDFNAGSTFNVKVWNGAALTTVGTIVLNAGGSKGVLHIHVKGGAAGIMEIYGGTPGAIAQLINLTAQNYASVVNMVRIYHAGALAGGGYNTHVAHEIVQTTSTLNTTCEIKPPNAQGGDVDGTGTFGSVNEAANNDTTYVNLPAAGNHQSFKAAARTLTQTAVLGVTVSARAWYEAGGSSQMKFYLKIGATRYYSPAINLTLVAAAYQYTWELDPSTGAAWTGAAANAATLEWGVEAV